MVKQVTIARDECESEILDVATIFRRYGNDIVRWATRLGGPLVDADDIVQDVLTVVHRRIRDFRPDAQVTTWLYKITHNIATTRRRRERFRRWLGGCPADYASDLPARGPSAVDVMEQREAAAEVYAALDLLDEKYRGVVILFEIEGLSGEEIAALTGTPLDQDGRGKELHVTRGELRSLAGRCLEALPDFEVVLQSAGARSDDRARALYGRASCRARVGDTVGAEEDRERYLKEFPQLRTHP
jgi:RNA polymerase sigma-70 factor (ECF subfamily)